jgi:hypothetical protein
VKEGDVIRQWMRMALSGPVVRRALKYAVVVGAILIAINHWDGLLTGDVAGGRVAKMALTVCVPYLVSTFSSVGAMRQAESQRELRGGGTMSDAS